MAEVCQLNGLNVGKQDVGDVYGAGPDEIVEDLLVGFPPLSHLRFRRYWGDGRKQWSVLW